MVVRIDRSAVAAGHLSRSARITGAVLLLDAAWMVAAGWTLEPAGSVGPLLAIALFSAILLVPRYRSDARIAAALRAGILLIAFGVAGSTLSYLVVSTAAPLVDAHLAALDQAVGFDWVALHRALQRHPPVRDLLRLSYQGGMLQVAFVVLYLALSNRKARLDEFVGLFIAASLVCIAVSWPFPAAGPWAHYGLGGLLDTSALSHFEPLRSGALRVIDLRQMQGLISIPSMHTALAVLLIHAMRGTGLWSWVFVALNLSMIAGTPIEGGHYLVDLPAGAVLAGLLILQQRWRRGPRRSTALCGRLSPAQAGKAPPLHTTASSVTNRP